MEQKVVTGGIPSFIGGTLRRPGSIVEVDTTQFGKKNDRANEERIAKKRNLTPNLADPGDARRAVTEVASIAPTGPAPTKPQQLPPGSHQDMSGCTGLDGSRLVAETAGASAGRAPGDPSGVEVEEEGTESAINTEFDAAAEVDKNVDDIVVEGRSADELDALRAAEEAGKNRTTAIERIDDAKAALSA